MTDIIERLYALRCSRLSWPRDAGMIIGLEDARAEIRRLRAKTLWGRLTKYFRHEPKPLTSIPAPTAQEIQKIDSVERMRDLLIEAESKVRVLQNEIKRLRACLAQLPGGAIMSTPDYIGDDPARSQAGTEAGR
ncbi:MAG TPA: hypothetical protein VGJ20_28850 [Xanthobacteraceae bacterium]|jgi:hypothetical protein